MGDEFCTLFHKFILSFSFMLCSLEGEDLREREWMCLSGFESELCVFF